METLVIVTLLLITAHLDVVRSRCNKVEYDNCMSTILGLDITSAKMFAGFCNAVKGEVACAQVGDDSCPEYANHLTVIFNIAQRACTPSNIDKFEASADCLTALAENMTSQCYDPFFTPESLEGDICLNYAKFLACIMNKLSFANCESDAAQLYRFALQSKALATLPQTDNCTEGIGPEIIVASSSPTCTSAYMTCTTIFVEDNTGNEASSEDDWDSYCGVAENLFACQSKALENCTEAIAKYMMQSLSYSRLFSSFFCRPDHKTEAMTIASCMNNVTTEDMCEEGSLNDSTQVCNTKIETLHCYVEKYEESCGEIAGEYFISQGLPSILAYPQLNVQECNLTILDSKTINICPNASGVPECYHGQQLAVGKITKKFSMGHHSVEDVDALCEALTEQKKCVNLEQCNSSVFRRAKMEASWLHDYYCDGTFKERLENMACLEAKVDKNQTSACADKVLVNQTDGYNCTALEPIMDCINDAINPKCGKNASIMTLETWLSTAGPNGTNANCSLAKYKSDAGALLPPTFWTAIPALVLLVLSKIA